LQDELVLGNLDAKRDWGHAKDYVQMQWMILQSDLPDDYVISTGNQYSVREFINKVCYCLDMNVEWKGEGLNEVGIVNGRQVIRVDKKYFRPTEVETLLGDASKARNKLGWKPKYSFDDLVSEMTNEDLKIAKKESEYK